MKDILTYCLENKRIISIYSDKDNTDLHLTGYVVSINDKEILISHITSYGEYDGFILQHLDNIYRVDYDGEYEKKIEKLYKLKKQYSKVPDLDIYGKSLFCNLIDFAKHNNKIITLEFQDNILSGFVCDNNIGIISIDIVNEFGKKEGKAVISINEILTVAVDTVDEQTLLILYNN